MPLTFLKDGNAVESLSDMFASEPVPPGQSAQFKVQVRNDFQGDATKIDWTLTEDPDARLLLYPTSLQMGETGDVIIEFAPAEGREKGYAGSLGWKATVQ